MGGKDRRGGRALGLACALRRVFVSVSGEPVPLAKGLLSYALACAVVVSVVWASLAVAGIGLDFGFVGQYKQRIADGFALTLELSAASLLASLLLGLCVAAGQEARLLPLRYLCDLYVKLVRGTPLLTQIYLFFYIIGTAWGINDRFIAGVIILSVFEGAYIAEIIRGSYLSIDGGQIEAARALGMSRPQLMLSVVLPQMVARTLPALTGQFASVIKDSSLLSAISVIEITQVMREVSAASFNLFGCFLLLGVLYLCLTLPLSLVGRAFERRFDYLS